MNKKQRNERYEQIRDSLAPLSQAKDYALQEMIRTAKKMGKARWILLAGIFVFLFVYHFCFHVFVQLRMRERMARAVSFVLVAALILTSVDFTVLAASGNASNNGQGMITEIKTLSTDILQQYVEVGAEESDIDFPESLNVTASHEKEVKKVTESDSVIEKLKDDSEIEWQIEDETTEDETSDKETSGTTEEQQTIEDEETSEPASEENSADETTDINEVTPSESTETEESNTDNLISRVMDTFFPVMTVYAAEKEDVATLSDAQEESATDGDKSGTEEDTDSEPATKTVTEKRSVSVTWVLNTEKSSADTFSSEKEGDVFYYDAEISEDYSLADGVKLPEIKVTIGTKSEEMAFNKSQTIDGVKVTVLADEGVFPAGATLSVSKVDAATEEKVTDNVDAAREDDVNVAKSYTFDIKVLDADGNEIQPDTTKGQVKVSFALVEVTNDNLDVDVYHISDEILADDNKSAEKLDSNVETVEGRDAVVAETFGFSYYTVEFTYNNLQYVMNGDSKIALADILDYVGLTGTVTNAVSSNPELFSVAEEDGKWIVSANQAFSSEEWLKVIIDGIEYKIVVTDDATPVVTTVYAYDCQRSPAYPSAVGATIRLSGFQNPYDASCNLLGKRGPWTLNFYSKYEGVNEGSTKTQSSVREVSNKYGISMNEVDIYQLKQNGNFIGYVVFFGQLNTGYFAEMNGYYGYYLTDAELDSSATVNATVLSVGKLLAVESTAHSISIGDIDNGRYYALYDSDNNRVSEWTNTVNEDGKIVYDNLSQNKEYQVKSISAEEYQTFLNSQTEPTNPKVENTMKTGIDPVSYQEGGQTITATVKPKSDRIKIENLNPACTYALLDMQGNVIKSYTAVESDGSITFDQLSPNTDYYLQAKAADGTLSEKEKITTKPQITVTVGDYEWGYSLPSPELSSNESGYQSVIYYYSETNPATNEKLWSSVQNSKQLAPGTYYVYAKIIDATGEEIITEPTVLHVTEHSNHTYGDWIIERNATTTTEGRRYKICSVCDEKQYEMIPALANTDNGNLTKAAEVKTGAPATSMNTSKETLLADNVIFNDTERTLIENGTDAIVWLEIKALDESVIPVDDKTKIDNKVIADLGKDAGIMYLDLTLWKKLSTQASATQIHMPENEISITITIPESIRNTDSSKVRTYYILRVHNNGDAETIASGQADGNGDITFKSNKFSTYAIAYKDTNKPSSGGDSGSGGGSGSESDSGSGSDDNSNNNNSNTNPGNDNANVNPANTNPDSNTNPTNNADPSKTNTTPKTGDDFDARTWIYLMMLGIAGIGGTFLYRKKKNGEEK